MIRLHIFFIDESGTPPKPNVTTPKYFVVGGVIMPEGVWHRVRDLMLGMKLRYKIRGEIKWRFFSPHNEEPKNPMRHMQHDARDAVRRELIKLIVAESSLRIIACVCSAASAYEMSSLQSQEDLYHGTYKPVTERFQYYLQDISRASGSRQFGIVVADHRNQQNDLRLRRHHQKLLYASGEFITQYNNLIEGLFLAPSNLSVGIQLADLVAGSIWRKFERGDSTYYDLLTPAIRRGPSGAIDGYGIVKFPKKNWR
jgi:hypothetical protein